MTDGPRLRSPRARLGAGGVIVLALGALAVVIGVGVWRGAASPVEPVAVETPTASIAAGQLYVHVQGAVREPGLYVLDAGARVVDAVSAAGGFADDADESGVNLARPVADGEQLAVPVEGEAPASGAPDAPGAPAGPGLVNLNTADAAALEELPRIGPAIAERIIAWRDENGPFTAVDDLLAVSGIGDAMLDTLRPLVTV
ncbi:ComEA family DNA-binding protein [Microbacterium gilvum]|uniref:Soluble ligand binding domain-containing protein n=1 Tax=Microbacterium gilvum TaxID=1336204 RepID=A0ABP8ZV93_9MICO